MSYFVNLENMCKYATASEDYKRIFRENDNCVEVTEREYKELEDRF